VLAELRGKADIIVLLSDLDIKKEHEVAKAAPGIYFVLGGHEGEFTEKPLWEGNTPILESSVYGMYSGMLHPTFLKASAPFAYKTIEGISHGLKNSKVNNWFVWSLLPLYASQEDSEISSWIRQSGVEKD
jgi:2',3'-cyclic-nucleotide 2'-phosphodiesterase (5'-nucleotidase family)